MDIIDVYNSMNEIYFEIFFHAINSEDFFLIYTFAMLELKKNN